MKVLKEFELNNKVLDDFDTLMTYHLDQVEELKVKEISINPKLYNIISLCVNVKTLIIEGDMRVDTNKIVYNLCKPELLENIIFDSVKLPTNKIIGRFTNLHTISLNNIKFSDIYSFFNQIGNKDSVIALNLNNVDLIKRSISICEEFKNLQYLNINNVINCKFDNFDFLINNKNLQRINIQNIELDFQHVNNLCKLKCNKTVEVNLKTSNKCEIKNSFEIDEDGISCVTVNITDIESVIGTVSFFKIDKLYIILNDNVNLGSYIKNLKKIKERVSIAIKDILYLDVETTERLREKIGVEYINIFEDDINFKIKHTYKIEKYLKLRKEFDKLKELVKEEQTDTEKFLILYEHFKNEYTLVKPSDNDELEDVIMNKACVYNLFAPFFSSVLGLVGIESKVIEGTMEDYPERLKWNQVCLEGKWYNLDIASDKFNKINKKIKLNAILKNYLFTDEQFYKTHSPSKGKPEECYTSFEGLKIDEEEDKGIAKKIFGKFLSIKKVNRKGGEYDTK